MTEHVRSPRVGAVFAALADDTRRAVLDAVGTRGTATATELADVVGVTRQAVAKHLAILLDAGLVDAERIGRETRYRVVAGSLRPVSDWATATAAAWDDRLDRLRRRFGEAAATPPASHRSDRSHPSGADGAVRAARSPRS